MPAAKNLEGQTFGRLLVLCRNGTRGGRVLWGCRCVCGTAVLVVSNALTSGHTKSCGCWKDERNRATPIIHGHALRASGKTPIYYSWQGMLLRCLNPISNQWHNYGGRGITVCENWKVFEGFLTDMGERPTGMTLDRKDSNGNYEPSNCRWATKTEQARNTRANALVMFQGTSMTQVEFSEKTGMNQSTVSYRLRAGWTPEQVASIPAHTGNRIASNLGDEIDIPEELL